MDVFGKETAASETVEATGEFVEPVQLQVVCQSLWRYLPPDVTVITQDHLQAFGDVDQALSGFYEQSIERAAQATGVKEGKLRAWFERSLITPAGTRGMVYRGRRKTGGIPNTTVAMLENLHLIRGEWRAGARWYELTHDRLIEPIQKSNKTWEERKREKQREKLIIFLAGLVTVLACLSGILVPAAVVAIQEARQSAKEAALTSTPLAATATKMALQFKRQEATLTQIALHTDTPTLIPTATPTLPPTPMPAFTETPVPPTNAPTATYTPVPTNTPTLVPTNTSTATHIPTPTSTSTLVPTNTPTAEAPSPTCMPKATHTPTPTATHTPTTGPPPIVYSISPYSGDTESTVSVTVSGGGFQSGATAGIDNGIASIDLTSVTVVSPTQMTGVLDLSIAAGGPYDVQVTNPDQQSGMAANAFTVTIPITYSYLITATGGVQPELAEGEPDGSHDIIWGGEVITGDFGPGNGIMDGRGYDFAFYELYEDLSGGPPYFVGIYLNSTVIELSQDQQTWYRTFNWGDGYSPMDDNTNITAFSNDANGEVDNEAITSTLLYDWPDYPSSGILIDINFLSDHPDARYRYVRLSRPYTGCCAEVDAIERLH